MKVKCPLCDFTTDDAAEMAGHLFSCHTKPGSTKFAKSSEAEEQGETYYECQFCGAKFKSYADAQTHVLNYHAKELEARMIEMEKQKKSRSKAKAKD